MVPPRRFSITTSAVAASVVKRRGEIAGGTRGVAAVGVLDVDDVRPVESELIGRERRRHDPRHGEHLDAGKRLLEVHASPRCSRVEGSAAGCCAAPEYR
jgi:hypothetical protein